MTTAAAVKGEDERTILDIVTPHWFSDCNCVHFTRVVSIDYPVRADIRVRQCTDLYGRRPIGDAIDALSSSIGIRFIDKNLASSLIDRYSTAIPGKVLDETEPVVRAGFGRTYYVRRDIMRACICDKRKKCAVCGDRTCRDSSHRVHFESDLRVLDRMAEGDVYVLLHEPTQYVKVGFSSQPAKRLRSHAAAIPGKLLVLGVFPGGRSLEGAIHDDLSDWLVPGYQEWFFYSPTVKDYLSRISGLYADYVRSETNKEKRGIDGR
jgi:hypothetical protein